MFNYDRNVVAAAYRAAFPDNRKPTAATLEKFDATLTKEYENELKSRGAAVPSDKVLRSWVVFYAARSSAKLVKTRVDHGIEFYKAAKPTV